jgi:6-phosphogluconate dehydrogenase
MTTLAMIGLGRMGANMVRRLLRDQHRCVVYDRDPHAVAEMVREGAESAPDLSGLVRQLGASPRIVWLMVPAAVVAATVDELRSLLGPGDILIDGGNSNFRDARQRSAALAPLGIRFVDVGTSGGIWGLRNGYCLMIGGESEAVQVLQPIFQSLAPGTDESHAPAATANTASQGYLHCGPSGAGHFVKMVHNGIEYGLMAAFAEGFNILRHAGAGLAEKESSAEVSPLAEPEAYQYTLPLDQIAELWRHGSVVRSWLLDLIAEALPADPHLNELKGAVADSGEGRWTVQAAVDVGVPAPVLSAALFARFASRGEDDYANKLLSAMRLGFGGHAERADRKGDGT